MTGESAPTSIAGCGPSFERRRQRDAGGVSFSARVRAARRVTAECGWIFSLFTRRGSASSTSNSNSPGPATSSPRPGTRPAIAVIRPADRIDVLGFRHRGKIEADGLGNLVQRRARVDEERAVGADGDLRTFHLVVLVLDVADDRLDDVLDRNQSVGPAIFVDHQRHVRPRRLHLHQQIERGHRRRREQNRPAGSGLRTSGMFMPTSTPDARSRAEVSDFGGAKPNLGSEARKSTKSRMWIIPCGIVEGFAENRQAGMAGGAEQREQLAQRRVGGNGDDVGARHHHVGDADVVQRRARSSGWRALAA